MIPKRPSTGKPVRSSKFQVTSNVCEFGIPAYDCKRDPHCSTLCTTNGFRRHWSKMEKDIYTQQNGVSAVEVALSTPVKPFNKFLATSGRVASASSKRLINTKLRASVMAPTKPAPSTPYSNRMMTPRTRTREKASAPEEFNELFEFKPETVLLPFTEAPEESELFKTYAAVLYRTESFHRRQIINDEGKRRAHLSRQADYLVEWSLSIAQKRVVVEDNEVSNRDGIAHQELQARTSLTHAYRESKKNARANEEVFPSCATLTQYECQYLPSVASTAFVCDIRWRGDQAIDLCAIAFDVNNKLIGIASPETGPITRSGGVLARPWGDHRFEGAGIHGERRTIEVLLHQSHARTVQRIVFCLFNSTHPGKSLSFASRCYFTVRSPVGDVPRILSSTALTELSAFSVPLEGAPALCMIAGSVARRSPTAPTTDPDWYLQCHNKPFDDVPSCRRAIPALRESLLLSIHSLQSAYEAEYIRLQKMSYYFYERMNRLKITMSQETERDVIQTQAMRALQKRDARRARLKLRRNPSWWDSEPAAKKSV